MSPLDPITSSRRPVARAVRHITRRQLVAALPAASRYARASLHTSERETAFAILAAVVREEHQRGVVPWMWY